MFSPDAGRLTLRRLERDFRRVLAAPARNRERREGADADECGTDPDRRREAVDERGPAGVAAVVGEHRSEDGDSEDAAELADGVVGARRLALLFGAYSAKDDVRDRREEERHPDPR